MGNLLSKKSKSPKKNIDENNGFKKAGNTYVNEFSKSQVKALYDYSAAQEGDLSFKKGDKLLVLSKDDQDWWTCRNIKNNKEGMVPSNYVADDDDLNSKEWFFGKPTRSEVERELKAPGNIPGTFLVRKSETAIGTYSLSLLDEDKQTKEKVVKHYRIKNLDGERGFYIATKTTFNSLDELISHYSAKNDGLARRLVKPCPKEAPVQHDLGFNTKENWEIDRSTITMESRLGSGMFGEVWRGRVKGKAVAIKTLKAGSMPVEKFMDEATVMKTLRHPNIVSLLAVCSTEPIYIITELMEHGSLLSFLRAPKNNKMKVPQRIDMGGQIATGMAYIEKMKFCHRDLAARNVLVGGRKLTCKIADFGLSRAIDEDVYEATAGAKFPIKWTAPEAANMGTFTIKSDVWSYGIVLVEIFTNAQHPYPNMPNQKVLEMIETGYRMDRPGSCPDDLYKNILMKCWEYDPEKRPTFEYLEEFMNNYSISSERQYQD